jgi:hypothetical protein
MARRIADKNLDSKEARRKLSSRGKPHWRGIERGLHLGYRRLSDGADPWIVRRYLGKQQYEEERIASSRARCNGLGISELLVWFLTSFRKGV